MNNIRIGDTITIHGITGTVEGIERLEDETIVGVIIKSWQIQHPYNLGHFRISSDHSWQFQPDLSLN